SSSCSCCVLCSADVPAGGHEGAGDDVLADDEVEMKGRDETSRPSTWGGAPAAKLSPTDVQQKEFRVARFGAGYRMREVDEFLDHVTDVLTTLIAENERLLRTAGPRSSGAPTA